jgi:tetratricopeptide (TPR) repeat protein
MNKRSWISAACCTLVMALSSATLAQPAAYWGVQFPTSESGAAQQHFLEGVTAMHLHMFEDAEEHFLAAQQQSSDFAMAYWGEALNNHRTIWSIHRLDAARAALRKLGPTPQARAARAPSQREKDYLAAIEILFGEGDFTARQEAYSAAMAELSENYPEDMEAKAWYALSLMRITPPDHTRERTRSLMASLSLEVLAQNPRHPGANRYLIQSTDDPVNTDLGIIAVNNLELLDIDAAEALHIPSHYYIQHGMWLETAESNMRAFASSMAWVAEHDWQLQDLNNHNYGHLLRFANYGYLQAGIDSEAEKIRQRVLQDFIDSGGAAEIAAPLADTWARWVIDLERWQQADTLAKLAREHSLRQPNIWTAIGLGAVRSGNLELAREALAALGDMADGTASEGDIAALQVEGLIRIAEGNTRQGLSLLNDAIRVNDEMNTRNPVTLIGIPPRPVKPSRELYGEALLETGSAAMALREFQTGLTVYQGRTNMMLGAARAALAIGDDALALGYLQQLSATWSTAEEDHPFKNEVEQALR